MTTEQRADAIEKQSKIAVAKLRVTQKFVEAEGDAEYVLNKAMQDRKLARDQSRAVSREYEDAAKKLQDLLIGAEVLA